MVRSWGRSFILLLAGAIMGLAAGCAQANMPAEPPLATARTINEVLDRRPGVDVQMVLVHGMRTADRNTWIDFRGEVCGHLEPAHACIASQPPQRVTDRLDLGPRPDGYFLSNEIWKTADAWIGSRPFVDHYAFPLKDGRRLVLHEVNWWPLVFALKCQFIVPDDTRLVGPNKDNIEDCAADPAQMRYGWLPPGEVQTLLGAHPLSGGAPWLNRGLKTDILDWGIADAVLSLGTMKTLLRETIRCSFDDLLTPSGSVPRDPAGVGLFPCDAPPAGLQAPADNFIIASHSLGAFLLLDTFASAAGDAAYYHEAGPCEAVANRSSRALTAPQEPEAKARRNARRGQSLCLALQASSDLYFLANQFPLIELGRAQGIDEPARSSGAAGHASFVDALTLWSEAGRTPKARQIVAFSDPGDLLTYKLPQVGEAAVYNAYPKNDSRWLGIFENPQTAHLGYFKNKDVLRAMFGR